MASIKQHLALLSVITLLWGCQKTQPAPGYGVSLAFSCLECQSISVSASQSPYAEIDGYFAHLLVRGNKGKADPLIEQQVRDYYSKTSQADVYNGGSVLEEIVYCDKVCEDIKIVSSSEVLGFAAGEDLSSLFTIYYSEDSFLFDKDLNLIGVVTSSIQDYLSSKARMLPQMDLLLRTDAALSGTHFTVTVTLEGGETLTASCTLP